MTDRELLQSVDDPDCFQELLSRYDDNLPIWLIAEYGFANVKAMKQAWADIKAVGPNIADEWPGEFKALICALAEQHRRELLQRLTDEELFTQFSWGDEPCMGELRRRYTKPAMDYAFERCEDTDLAREIVNDTFEYIIAHAGYRSTMGFRVWFYTVCMNVLNSAV